MPSSSKSPQKKTVEKKEVIKETVPNPAKKKKFPTFIAVACGCLACCVVSGIIGGVVYWLKSKDKTGPVYNEEPLVDILEPTGSNWYTTYEDNIVLSGIAKDYEENIDKIEWSVEGGDSGTITAGEEWNTSNITLKEGDNKITVSVYDNEKNVGTDSIFVVYNKEVIFIGDPIAVPDVLYKDDPAVDVIISAKVRVESDKKIGEALLYDVDDKGEIKEKIGVMLDNGKVTNGDDIPGDGTFSYKGKMSATSLSPKYMRVVTKLSGSSISGMSSLVKVSVIEPISQQALDQIEQLNQQVLDLQNQLNNDGASQQEIATEINTWVGQQPGIAGNGVSEQGQGVWWVYENTCIPGGIMINPPDTRGGQSDGAGFDVIAPGKTLVSKASAASDLKVESTKAIYLGPYKDDFGAYDDYNGAWKKIKESTCPECETVEKMNYDVTVDDFKNLDQYGLIVISSHGDNWYGGMWGDNICSEGLQQSQVVILTNQKLTTENMKTYEADLMARRLAVHANGNLVVLPSFITHYNSNFPNSVVYVATCRSSYNNTMASAFLGSGADAYYGFDDYVLSSYCYDVGTDLFDSFVLEGDDASTSYSGTVSAVGSSDGQGADFLWTGESTLEMGGKDFGNVSFESGTFNSWAGAGDDRIITSLGPIKPKDGNFMAIISTGLGSVSDSKSSIKQSICYGKSGGKLKFDYNLVSEEPQEFVGSPYDDRLSAYIIVDGKKTKIMSKGVNDSTWIKVQGIDFEGGDASTFQTGWKTITYSLSGVKSGSKVGLLFEIKDVGDSAYDTAALIDNIRVD
ncbi:MAG: hypothetical protein ABIE03_01935 [Patescibacteria group bacterium]|nr:hypothetical protein [Patescibacteria group bacterium]